MPHYTPGPRLTPPRPAPQSSPAGFCFHVILFFFPACAVEDDAPAALAEYDGPGAPVGSRALFFSRFFAPNATHWPSS